MKKSLILFSVLFSMGSLADVEAETPGEAAEPNFVVKSFTSAHKKCTKARADVDVYAEKVAHWEAVKEDCIALDQILATRFEKAASQATPVSPADIAPAEAAPILPAADLPKADL